MLAGSVTSASGFMRPLHLGQASMSTANVRARSSAQGRYPPAPFGVSGSAAAAASGGGFGTMRALHVLAGASTPAYLTVWNRGGGTLVASRHSSDSGSMSTATVPSAYAFFSVSRLG